MRDEEGDSQPFLRARRAASMRLAAPSLLIAFCQEEPLTFVMRWERRARGGRAADHEDFICALLD
jgi:hypothetical protein